MTSPSEAGTVWLHCMWLRDRGSPRGVGARRCNVVGGCGGRGKSNSPGFLILTIDCSFAGDSRKVCVFGTTFRRKLGRVSGQTGCCGETIESRPAVTGFYFKNYVASGKVRYPKPRPFATIRGKRARSSERELVPIVLPIEIS
jgi:hypothetical protein